MFYFKIIVQNHFNVNNILYYTGREGRLTENYIKHLSFVCLKTFGSNKILIIIIGYTQVSYLQTILPIIIIMDRIILFIIFGYVYADYLIP